MFSMICLWRRESHLHVPKLWTYETELWVLEGSDRELEGGDAVSYLVLVRVRLQTSRSQVTAAHDSVTAESPAPAAEALCMDSSSELTHSAGDIMSHVVIDLL